MRLFVAVPLPLDLKEALGAVQERYSEEFVRYIPAENLHLTLHFMGETNPEALSTIQEKLKNIASSFAPFRVRFMECSPGPKLHAPRLIWARFFEHPDFNNLGNNLCQDLMAAPGQYGKFIPHITIARYRKNIIEKVKLPVLTHENIPDLVVNTIALWQSELSSPHPVYSILKEYSLTGPI